jgi:DNA-binding transcriptional regulator YhcF (GntR family)
VEALAGLVLDRAAEVPIGVQLVWALRTRIGDGRFAPGQRLPGLRELAQALHINANTARAVYQRLEREGFIVSQQGSGTFVADTPRKSPAVGTIAASAAQQARDTGVDPRDIAAALYAMPPPASALPADAQALRRRTLRRQIAALELTLGELETRYPARVPKARRGRTAASGRLLDVGELEHVQAHLLARLAAVHAAVDELAGEPPAAAGEPPPAAGAPSPAAASSRSARPRAKTRPAPAGA